jgi:flagellar M-ring protein FliF
LIIIWLVIRPVVKALTYKEPEPEPVEVAEGEEAEAAALLQTRPGGLSLEDWKALGVSQEEFEQMLQFVRDMVKNDPRLVAQVVKTWVTLEDESAGRASKPA